MTKFGVIADVHGNLPALEAVIAKLEQRGVERYLVAGDLVGYGPHPNECVRIVDDLDATVVAGNHELILAGALPEGPIHPQARQTLQWTRAALDDRSRAILARLPRTVALPDGIVLTHASLTGPTLYVRTTAQAANEFKLLAAHYPDARVLIVGHTHRRAAWSMGEGRLRPASGKTLSLDALGPHLLNPGSVGQSRGLRPLAQAAILDVRAGTVEFLSVDYPKAGLRRDLARAGLPTRTYHMIPWAPTHWNLGVVAALRDRMHWRSGSATHDSSDR